MLSPPVKDPGGKEHPGQGVSRVYKKLQVYAGCEVSRIGDTAEVPEDLGRYR